MNRTILISFFCMLSFFFFSSCEGGKEKTNPTAGVDSLVKVKTHRPGYNVENGEVEERFANGVVRIKGYKMKGKREGLWRSWYENGQLNSELSFVHDDREGPYGVWYENGKKMVEGEYKKDVAVGKWKYWDNRGNLAKEVDNSASSTAAANK
jgi:antitoxin component YwqK of YwqJK toxin-antitoxin module